MKITRSWENSLEEGGKGGFQIKERNEQFAKSSPIHYICQQSSEQVLVALPSLSRYPIEPTKCLDLTLLSPLIQDTRNHLLGRDRAGTEGWDIWLPPSATLPPQPCPAEPREPVQSPYWSRQVLLQFCKGWASSTRTFSPTAQRCSHSGAGRAKGHGFSLLSYEDCKGTNSQQTLVPHRDTAHNQCHRYSCSTCLALAGNLF